MNGKFKITFGQIFSFAVILGAGILCGITGVNTAILYLENTLFFYFATEADIYLMLFVPVLLSFYLSYFLSLIAHEAGHLVFGLMSGYRFSSFRVGSLILIKSNGKLKLKRYTLMGTGGQCIMLPPDAPNGTYPYRLYNMGGCIMNLVCTAVFALCYYFMPLSFFSVFSVSFAILSLAVALANGIPLKMGLINNDGYNAINLGNNPAAMKALWHHLSLYKFLGNGLSLKDIQTNYFYEPSDEELNDPIVAGYASAVFARYLNLGDNEKTFSYAEHLLTVSKGLLPVHRASIEGELLFFELCGERRSEEINKYLTPMVKRIMKAYKSGPTAARFAYAYEKYQGNEKKAERIMKCFEKSVARYPYEGEAEFEKQLISLVK